MKPNKKAPKEEKTKYRLYLEDREVNNLLTKSEKETLRKSR